MKLHGLSERDGGGVLLHDSLRLDFSLLFPEGS